MIRPVGEIVEGGAPVVVAAYKGAAGRRREVYGEPADLSGRYKRRHTRPNRAQRRTSQAKSRIRCGDCQSRRVQVLRDNDSGEVIGHRCHRSSCGTEVKSA